MAFVGQLYSSDWLPMGALLALQFYACHECQESRPSVHMGALPAGAAPNPRRIGVRCLAQPTLHISYTAVEDSTDQWSFNRRRLTEDDLPDTHLRQDKVGGLFPYNGSEGPKVTRQNRMAAQFVWPGIRAAACLYHSSRWGFSPYLYW